MLSASRYRNCVVNIAQLNTLLLIATINAYLLNLSTTIWQAKNWKLFPQVVRLSVEGNFLCNFNQFTQWLVDIIKDSAHQKPPRSCSCSRLAPTWLSLRHNPGPHVWSLKSLLSYLYNNGLYYRISHLSLFPQRCTCIWLSRAWWSCYSLNI